MSDDITIHHNSKIELTATYNIEIFATKSSYENSDTINAVLVWVENGEVGEETGIICVEATPTLVQSNNGVISIKGVAGGTEIIVYNIGGTEIVRAIATNGITTIDTGMTSGTIAIIKIGHKSVKIGV